MGTFDIYFEPLPPKKLKAGVNSIKIKQAFSRVVFEVQSNWFFLSTFFGQVHHVNLNKPSTEQKPSTQKCSRRGS